MSDGFRESGFSVARGLAEQDEEIFILALVVALAGFELGVAVSFVADDGKMCFAAHHNQSSFYKKLCGNAVPGVI